MKIKTSLLFILFVFFHFNLFSSENKIPEEIFENNIYVVFPEIIVSDIQCDIKLFIIDQDGTSLYPKSIIVNGEEVIPKIIENELWIDFVFKEKEEIYIQSGNFEYKKTVNPIPLWLSIIPPLLAILSALIFREVFSAIFTGILFGAVIIYYYKGFSIFIAIFKGLFAVVDTYVLQSLSDEGHLSIIIFSMLIGAMVSLISRNGGMRGIVNSLSKYANSPASGQFFTWLMGVLIFFDDYANTLVVGNTMRPVTDRLKISREKLSYIVDSTAAPVASIAFVTTWIGAELSYINDGIQKIGLDESPYHVFINSLSYSFYPLLTLGFILMLIWQKREFGPMYKAEVNARKGINDHTVNIIQHEDLPIENIHVKPNLFNALIPVAIVIFGTIAGLIYTGYIKEGWHENLSFSRNLSTIIGSADSYKALLWSSISGVVVAVLLTISQRLLSLKESVESLMKGFKTMLTAILILTLAWSLALVTEHMHTADFITRILLIVNISPYLVPALSFILAGLISFSTGSSWGTMAILYPLILPSGWLISVNAGLDYESSLLIFYNIVSTVLAGSVLGDHCSPISDTTILSSLASSCPHIDHVKTQLPYAISVGAVSIFFGTIPSAYGISSYILFPFSLFILFLIIRFVGKKI